MMVGMWKWLRKLRVNAWAPAAWVFTYIAYLCSQRVDLDFGWHYRSGEYILAHGVPRYDIFTYTARDFAWINHEWLSDAFMYWVAHHLGYDALAVLMAAAWAAALIIAVKTRRLGWIAAGLALSALVLYVGVRPVAWTVLGLALVLKTLEGKRQHYWVMVPLFALGANLHAGFALGLAMVALKAGLDRSRWLGVWGLAAAVATLVNPYGYGVYVELWRTMSDGKLSSRIVEWGPLALNYTVTPYVVAVIVILMLMQGWGFVRIRGAALVLAALWTNRQLPLMVVGTLGVVSGQIERGLRSLDSLLVGRRAYKWMRLVVPLAVGVLFPVAVLLWPPHKNGGVNLQQPVVALRQLKAHPCRGHIFNDYNFGGFIIWALPGVPDYIDGRMPSWRGPQGSYMDRYVEVLKGGAITDQEFTKYNIQCAVLSRYDDKLSRHVGRQAGWRLAVKAGGTELWRRD
jgi:hypothetical protein